MLCELPNTAARPRIYPGAAAINLLLTMKTIRRKLKQPQVQVQVQVQVKNLVVPPLL